MTEHLSKSILEHFPDRSMAATTLARVALHLEECRDCDRTWRELGRWRRSREPDELVEELLSETGEVEWCHLGWLADEHLDEAALSQYRRSRLQGDDLEMVELHLRECDHCRARARPSPAELFGRDWAGGRRLAWGLASIGIIWLTIWFAMEPHRRFSRGESKSLVPDPDRAVPTGVLKARPGSKGGTSSSPPRPPATTRRTRSGLAGSVRRHPPRKERSTATLPFLPRLTLTDAGRNIRLHPDGHLTGLEELASSERRWIGEILQHQELPDSGVAELQVGEAPRLRALSTAESQSATGIRLLKPLPEVLRETRPIFQWQPHPAAITYQLEIHEIGGAEVLRSEALGRDTQRWQPPRPLRRGSTWVALLRVHIEAAGISSLSSSPRLFRILGEPERRHLASLRARTSSHLAIGLLSARYGLISEARQEIEILAAENPESVLVKRFLLRLLAESYEPN